MHLYLERPKESCVLYLILVHMCFVPFTVTCFYVFYLKLKWIKIYFKKAELFPFFSQLGEEKVAPSFSIIISAYYIQKLSLCENLILWTIIWSLLWGVPNIFPASCLFWKISQPDENCGTPFFRNSSRGALREFTTFS